MLLNSLIIIKKLKQWVILDCDGIFMTKSILMTGKKIPRQEAELIYRV